jgi:hypothetical protein
VAFQSQANPRDFAFRITYGLALLKEGKNKEALALIESCEPDVIVETLPPHQKAIVAAALAANGRRKEALSVMSTVPPQQLSVQEIDFLRPYLAEPTTTPTPTPSPRRRKRNEPRKSKRIFPVAESIDSTPHSTGIQQN